MAEIHDRRHANTIIKHVHSTVDVGDTKLSILIKARLGANARFTHINRSYSKFSSVRIKDEFKG